MFRPEPKPASSAVHSTPAVSAPRIVVRDLVLDVVQDGWTCLRFASHGESCGSWAFRRHEHDHLAADSLSSLRHNAMDEVKARSTSDVLPCSTALAVLREDSVRTSGRGTSLRSRSTRSWWVPARARWESLQIAEQHPHRRPDLRAGRGGAERSALQRSTLAGTPPLYPAGPKSARCRWYSGKTPLILLRRTTGLLRDPSAGGLVDHQPAPARPSATGCPTPPPCRARRDGRRRFGPSQIAQLPDSFGTGTVPWSSAARAPPG